MNESHHIAPGFEDAVRDSQAAFRTLLDALSQPGRVWRIPSTREPALGLAPATAELCLCVLDRSTALWVDPALDSDAIGAFLRFHTGCETTHDPAAADFAILRRCQDSEILSAFNAGTPEFPDRSCTVFIQANGLADDMGVALQGPGIESTQRLTVDGAGPAFWSFVKQNNERYPLGIDIVFIAGDDIAGLPRSTRVGI